MGGQQSQAEAGVLSEWELEEENEVGSGSRATDLYNRKLLANDSMSAHALPLIPFASWWSLG